MATGLADLDTHDQPEFVRRVIQAIQAECWVADGTYGSVCEVLWRRETHLIWRDSQCPVIMGRVISRWVYPAALGGEFWAGTGHCEHWHH